MSCCGSLRKQQHEPTRGVEKSMAISYEQPHRVSPPVAEPQERPISRSREWVARSRSLASRTSTRGNFTVKRTLNAYNGPRRPRIGAPSDFRHVGNALPSRREEPRFRPLELSIYQPQNQLSPILPHFTPEELSSPPSHLQDGACPSEVPTHSRSDSALSFRIPRKPLRSSSGRSSDWSGHHQAKPMSLSPQELLVALEKELPKVPQAARLRSMTEPPVYQRVKSALQEKLELEQRLKEIDIILEERRSVYMSSRATSVFEESEEPVPFPLRLPKPSFADRASIPLLDNQRPNTAPSKIVCIPERAKSFTEASAAFSVLPGAEAYRESLPPPPLPLVLQHPHPPLRKKKSFSRVSNWLKGNGTSNNNSLSSISIDIVTNTPKNITAREGFYQCVDLSNYSSNPESHRRPSITSMSITSTLPESDLDEPTLPASWTPQSSPSHGSNRHLRSKKEEIGVTIRGFDSEEQTSIELTRTRTFGQKESNAVLEGWKGGEVTAFVPPRGGVGVAF
ncbi:hypothetical protein B7463_g7769, partial [Scytalidium lignicola]